MTDAAAASIPSADAIVLDTSVCDVEPIHAPDAIQPHGLLLIADAATLTVVGGAGALEQRLSADWLGAALPDLIGLPVQERLDAAPQASTVALPAIPTPGGRMDVIVHRAGDRLIVELEPANPLAPSATEMLSGLELAAADFERSGDLVELCQRAAVVFRRMTGFDRVMVYRFLDDDAGVVMAEDRAPGEGSFLNHHFPASDIPKQARALYVRNRIRVIPDVGYTPASLRPAGAGLTGLDLSDAALRSVSPIHIQYLKNMGVGASASVSIVKDGMLWGLIACHHPTPRTISFDIRVACRALAGGLGRQIRAKEDAEIYRERIRLRSAEDVVVARLGADAALADFFASAGDEMQRMLGADGFAAIQGRELFTAGRCPPASDILALTTWVAARGIAQPFHTAGLSALYPPASAFAEIGSGLLAVTMSTEEPTVLLWFRVEHVQRVEWAGNPHKAATAGPDGVLTPRGSFKAWAEQVHGRARPFTLVEVEAASRLRRTLFEVRQNRRMRGLNRELSATIADKESLLKQKDFLIGEVNHRVQNSLQLVSAFLGMQARKANDPALGEHLAEAQRRLSAVALVHRRLYADENVQAVDLSRYLEELIADLASSMGEAWSRQMSVDLAPILVPADRAVNVGLILTELVINASKYAYGGEPGKLAIQLEPHRNRLRLIVADEGAGKAQIVGGRQGFGSRMLTAMVTSLGGELEETDNRPGLRIIVTAPMQGD